MKESDALKENTHGDPRHYLSQDSPALSFFKIKSLRFIAEYQFAGHKMQDTQHSIDQKDVTPWFAKPFQRVTTRGDHIREIDGLRFIAISIVLLLHLKYYVALDSTPPYPNVEHSPFGMLLETGSFGVQIFFVISGFILALPFANHYLAQGHPIKLKNYYLRRLTRLEPPLIINLTIIILLMVFALGRSFSDLLGSYLATCFYLHTIVYDQISPINLATWTLEVEIKFYLTMPLWAQLFAIRSYKWRQVIFAVLIAICALQPWVHHRGALLPQFSYFVVGFILADLWITRWKGRPSQHGLWDIIAALSWSSLFVALYWRHSITGYKLLLPAILLVAFVASFRGRFLSAILRHWIPVTIGGMCYTLYLYHLMLMAAATPFLARWIRFDDFFLSFLAHSFIQMPVVLALCGIFFVLFERPFMVWNPFGSKKTKTPTPASTETTSTKQ